MCFSIYHGDDDAEREKLVAAVMRWYEHTDNPRQRATMVVHGWSIGRAKPTFKFRQVLAPWIPMASWDIAAEVSS